MPPAIRTILSSRFLLIVARVLLTFMFWSAGLAALADFHGFSAQVAAVGVSSPELVTALVVLVTLLGSVLLITDVRRLGWLGAGMLGVFTFFTIPTAHAFWGMTGAEQMLHLQVASEHVGIIGGLIVAAMSTLWRPTIV